MNCASANKDSNELETNFNSGFLSFLGPNYTNKNSQKEKTVALNEHNRMEDVAINQGPRLTQELTLTMVFFSFGVRLARTKSAEKRIQMQQNERK